MRFRLRSRSAENRFGAMGTFFNQSEESIAALPPAPQSAVLNFQFPEGCVAGSAAGHADAALFRQTVHGPDGYGAALAAVATGRKGHRMVAQQCLDARQIDRRLLFGNIAGTRLAKRFQFRGPLIGVFQSGSLIEVGGP